MLKNEREQRQFFFPFNGVLKNDAGLSAGESLGARYRSQTFARPFPSILLVISRCLATF